MHTNAALAELIEKHATSVPRYTSYPTALELKPDNNIEPVTSVLRDLWKSQNPVSLYVHLPHCPSLCYFCACNKIISTKPEDRKDYLELLAREISLVKAAAGGKLQAGQLHLGGGSPSYLDSAELRTLLKNIADNFVFTDSAIKSIEIDPRTFSREKAAVLGTFGFTRASLGVQDFNPQVQELINRIQPLALTEQAVDLLNEQGIQEINFDLIYGLPGQTAETFALTVAEVVRLRPSRIALYGYAHVEWKVKVQHVFNKYPRPSPALRTQMFLQAMEAFEAAGYRYIGLDHFALPNDELSLAQDRGELRRNFMGYTTVVGAGVLGLGVSAISDLKGLMFQNSPKIEIYQSRLKNSQLPIEKILLRSREDSLRSWIIERLMCDSTLDLDQVPKELRDEQQLRQIVEEDLARLQDWEETGLLTRSQNTVKLSKIGRLFSRQIAAVFDSYLAKHQESAKPKFSQGM